MDSLLLEFQAQTRKNKLFIMHRLYTRGSRPEARDLVLYDRKNMNMVFCEGLAKHASHERNALLLRDHQKFKWKWLFEEGADFAVAGGLEYSGVSVCKLAVLTSFARNFDYHCENKDFLTSLLSSEVSADQVSFSVLPESVFAHKASSWGAFLEGIVKLLKQSSSRFGINKSAFRFGKLFQVVSSLSIISPRAGPLSNCFVGPNSRVAEGVCLRHAVLIENCGLEPRAELSHCYLAAGTSVAADFKLHNCVVLQENVRLDAEFLRARCIRHTTGAQSQVALENLLVLPDGTVSCIERKEPFEFGDDESYHLESESEEEEAGDYFERELRDVLGALGAGLENLDQVVADIVSLRLSQNRGFRESLSEILVFLWGRLFSVRDPRFGIFTETAARTPLDRTTFMQAVARLESFKPLLEKFTVGREEELFLLGFIKRQCEEHPDLLGSTLTQMVYKMEVVKAVSVLHFFEQVGGASGATEFDRQFVDSLGSFVKYLRNLEDESDSDSEGDSEGDSDSDTDSEGKEGSHGPGSEDESEQEDPEAQPEEDED